MRAGFVTAATLAGWLAAGGCAAGGERTRERTARDMTALREEMVRSQIAEQGIKDQAVLKAMREVPRHLFVPDALVPNAYEDRPLPIGEDQTISQPYIEALMTELARLDKGARALEVGTGSGYQAAILLHMGVEVYTIEIIPPLANRAKETLDSLYPGSPLHARVGDGYRGWPEAAPFDAVIVTAAPDHIPQPHIDQLKVGGRLVIPVGGINQKLIVITRQADGVRREEITPVRFVPMTGEAQKPEHPNDH
jgi:protein-L-isoaspartate(D-aspartate) O-methyltransferase